MSQKKSTAVVESMAPTLSAVYELIARGAANRKLASNYGARASQIIYDATNAIDSILPFSERMLICRRCLSELRSLATEMEDVVVARGGQKYSEVETIYIGLDGQRQAAPPRDESALSERDFSRLLREAFETAHFAAVHPELVFHGHRNDNREEDEDFLSMLTTGMHFLFSTIEEIEHLLKRPLELTIKRKRYNRRFAANLKREAKKISNQGKAV